jgi:hypothetical protein
LLDEIPHLNPEDLLGGTFSPEDGSASPLKAAFSFHKQAVQAGARFHFNETVFDFIMEGSRVSGVRTDRGQYFSHMGHQRCGWMGEAAFCQDWFARARLNPIRMKPPLPNPSRGSSTR